ncbi:DUF3108 domain-containing protein [Ideonella sp. 4Y16]|uniref:DUF3108 domain-containing protein n=1 Tax=Ideonella alba TaxID=2824118 RepID=A0A940Y5Y9_9BURK|nr:DUF3108 domain-containing protein [Ideonella alba]MBQ0930427.1 DUF3108 domain-containing protein [Ideonella alba]MBQ0945323.1 DUF3108 domain-containing protein [Ideonella alba]
MIAAMRRWGSGGRRLALAGLTVLVSCVHLGAGQWVSASLALSRDAPPAAIDVRFIQEMALTEPPPPALPPPARRPRPQPVVAAEPAASAVAEAASAPVPPPPVATAPPEPADDAASAVAEAPSPAASAPPPFAWPPSTQLLYALEGSYRGPIVGEAQVDWLREGERYQVRLEVRVPPLFKRRMLSDGLLGDEGLSPSRYDQETEVALSAPRRETVQIDGDRVQLANGKSEPRPPGLQDVASQFVQMTWLFLTRPELAQTGATVELPLALPRRVGRWIYRVQERGPLELPFGTIDAVHVVPQRDNAKPGELAVELWVAPGLLYLPVRIVIRQDADNYLDLRLKTAPRIAVLNAPSS